jgi:beta-galactosidase
VMTFPYLTSSGPDAFTSDQFVDLRKLELEPHFEQAIEQAFKPLGVYLNFWHPSVQAGDANYYLIYMVNDENRARSGTLRLEFAAATGTAGAAQEVKFSVPPFGAQQYTVQLRAPSVAGSYALQAIAAPDDAVMDPTISRHDVQVALSAAH